ncbi:hypothetical protein ABVV53_05850 [Novosphingobium sp. RD2P27]|uniref:Uncharacterized protein n=1 Tax=Novosphingobium kalidii TaxID=3230299 RepID=A0ABV2CZG4_9SPHN
MYEFVDRHPRHLGNPGRLLLWALRGWNQSMASKACPPLALYRGFCRVGASAALNDFHVASTLMRREGLKPLHVAPMDACRIEEDEAILLALWQGVAREDVDQVSGTLKLLVKPDAILAVARAMADCSNQMMRAGLDLSRATALSENLQ